MLIRKSEIEQLSANIRRIIDGQHIDLRDNSEGAIPILKNDINTLANLKNEQIEVLQRERDILRNRLEDISHQLKTPLTSTMIMADLLGSASPQKQGEFLANIKQSLARMEWLVSTLLKIAKLDAGVVDFSPETVQAEELTLLALEPLRIQMEVKDQQVELRGEAELSCDKRWTIEALTNLLKNASEYSPEGGGIIVEAGANPLCSWIAVTDSGPGIAPEDIPTLFKRFEGSRSSHGYGIGLPLALAIMRGQSGDIEIDGGRSGIAGVTGAPAGGTAGGAKDARGATFTLKLYR